MNDNSVSTALIMWMIMSVGLNDLSILVALNDSTRLPDAGSTSLQSNESSTFFFLYLPMDASARRYLLELMLHRGTSYL